MRAVAGPGALLAGAGPGAQRTPGCTVLGLGNVLLKDDGVGVWLVRRLKNRGVPPGVEVYELGTDIFALFSVARKDRALLLVDAVISGKDPGSTVTISPGNLRGGSINKDCCSLHDFRFYHVLEMLELSGQGREGASWCIFAVEAAEIDYGYGLTASLWKLLPLLERKLRAEMELYIKLR